MKNQTKKSEATARRILHAAARVIAFSGIEQASTTAIAKEAKVARSLVGHYFPIKAQLFPQVIDFILLEGYAGIEAAMKQSMANDLVVENFVQNFRFFSGYPEFGRCLILLYGLACSDPALRQLNTRIAHRATERIFESLRGRTLKNSHELAEALHSHLVGAVYKYLSTNDSRSPANYEKAMVKQVKKIIAAYEAEL